MRLFAAGPTLLRRMAAAFAGLAIRALVILELQACVVASHCDHIRDDIGIVIDLLFGLAERTSSLHGGTPLVRSLQSNYSIKHCQSRIHVQYQRAPGEAVRALAFAGFGIEAFAKTGFFDKFNTFLPDQCRFVGIAVSKQSVVHKPVRRDPHWSSPGKSVTKSFGPVRRFAF